MQPISRRQLEERARGYDAAVERDPAIDPFCSRSAWLLAYHDAFDPDRRLWAAREDDAWVLLAEQRLSSGRSYLEPLEKTWGFASPLVGGRAAALLTRALREHPIPVLLLGLPLDRDRLAPLASLLASGWRAQPLEPTRRLVASLAGGLDGWLGRRSQAFRRNLRAARRRVADAGVHFERVPDADVADIEPLYARVLRIEARSWKAAEGGGADSGPMRLFYAGMWPRLVPHGQLRLIFAKQGGHDVGYLHGALVRGRFRGLQFSFADPLRSLGLGNVLQYEMLRWICEQGAEAYDLGTGSDYKRRWAEAGLTTFGLSLRPPT